MSTVRTTNVKNEVSAINNLVLDSSGNVTVGNNLTVTGTTTQTGNVTFTGSAAVGGNVTIGGATFSPSTPASGGVAMTGTLAMGSSFLRNRIINGDMRIDQRNNGASVTPTDGQYLVDRWAGLQSVASKYSAQRNAGSVTPPAGFTNYLGATSLSAYSVGASEYFALRQSIEGFNTADLAWGTANAQTVTLSFWVRSSLTGTFGGALQNNASNRFYAFSYVINAANVWEYKTVSIAGDTTGTWATDNNAGIRVTFGLGVGSSFSVAAGSWGSSGALSVTGATSVVGTNGATFYITGVQLEVGSVATPFERRQYGQELALCQRYYWRATGASGAGFQGIGSGVVGNSTTAYFMTYTPVVMRSAPVLNFSGSVSILDGSATPNITSIANTYYTANTSGYIWFAGVASAGGLTAGRGAIVYCQAASTNWFDASSEL